MEPVAFQGERGANSEIAVLRAFGDVPTLPCRTLPEVFAAVSEGKARAALVPAENSLAGSIHQTYDLLLDHELVVVGELDLPVRHALMGLPGQRLDQIREVLSHPQALAQCDAYLRNLGVELVATYDTAGSAKMVAAEGRPERAAIAAPQAAAIYGLEILALDIQTRADNVTKFYVLSRSADAPLGLSLPPGTSARTILAMAVGHQPGSLHWALGALAFRAINLCKIESRPSRNLPWQYVFHLVIEGRADEPVCAAALRDLADKAAWMRVFGSYNVAESSS